jgi:uncharacterized OsmC-like protein
MVRKFRTPKIRPEHIGRRTFSIPDEPGGFGGAGEGSPATELLMAALGICASVMVPMHAERKQWTLRKVYVEVRREHAISRFEMG